MRSLASNLAGYSVIGRHGFLGTVVDADATRGEGEGTIVFTGGVSDALRFHVSTTLVQRISERNRTLTVDVDVGDFVPRLGADGTVELHLHRTAAQRD